jgi:hypothetical protein
MKSVYHIGTNLIYAKKQEFGGTIRAKGGGFLVFEVDGAIVRVKSVTLPAHPYLRPAFDEKSAAAVVVVGKVFERLVIGPVT